MNFMFYNTCLMYLPIIVVWLEDYCKEDGIYSLSMISEDIYVGELNFTFRAGMEEDFTCTVIVGRYMYLVVPSELHH